LYIRVFLLLGYVPATANEHYQSGFKVFHLVEVDNYILSGLYLQTSLSWVTLQEIFISIQYSSTGHGSTQTFPPR